METRDADLNIAKSQHDERMASALKFLKTSGVPDKGRADRFHQRFAGIRQRPCPHQTSGLYRPQIHRDQTDDSHQSGIRSTLTINIQGQLTLDRKSLEQFLSTVTTPKPIVKELPKPSPSESSFLNEMQILAKLSVSRRTLFGWRMAGKIPSVKLGRRVLYHWPSVEAALLRLQPGGW